MEKFMTNVFDKLIEKAKQTNKRIVLTETEDERVIEAAQKAAEINLCKIILLGKEREMNTQVCFLNLEKRRE
jgi:phosphate acetyltransferase